MKLIDFLPHGIDDKLSYEERQYAVKSYSGCDVNLPRYRSRVDNIVFSERDKIYEEYVKTNTRFEFLAADKEISSEFDHKMTLDGFPSEYVYLVEEVHKSKIIFRRSIPFIVSYAGFVWDNLLGMLYVMLHQYSPKSKEFTELAEKYSTYTHIPWSNITSSMKDDDIMKIIENFFKYLFKDPTRHMNRYMVYHREEIIKRGGIRFMAPDIVILLNEKSVELTEKSNVMFIDLLNSQDDNIRHQKIPPKVDSNIRVPSDSPSLSMNIGVSKPSNIKEFVNGIFTFKVIEDRSSNKERFIPMMQPYKDSALYDPPVTRGVSKKDQPYRFILANSSIDFTDLENDTMSMRKVVITDMLTKALDWAASKGLPLPSLGSEVYINSGDEATECMKDLFIGTYARKRGDHVRLIPFPDYSYQVFSRSSRFNIHSDVSASWGDTKKYILDTLKSDSIRPTTKNMFFIGNDVSLTGIRKDLWFIQGKTSNLNPPLKPNTLKIKIPKLDSGEPEPPMSIPEMGKYKVLLDLPGFSLWSTRLKFISLTDSHVIRIVHYRHFWNEKTMSWDMADKKKDIWETFTDSFLPVEVTHSLFTDHYSPVNVKDPEVNNKRKKLNIESKNKLLNALSKLYSNIDSKANLEKSRKARSQARGLTDDHILEFVYRFIMKQSEYYGFDR